MLRAAEEWARGVVRVRRDSLIYVYNMAAARGSVVRKARGRPRRRWSSRNQGGVACGVGLSVGCMVSKLYEYAFTGAGVGGGQTSPFGGPPPSSHQYVSTFSSAAARSAHS